MTVLRLGFAIGNRVVHNGGAGGPRLASSGIVRATVPVMRSTTATTLSRPIGTIATPLT